MNEDRRQFDRDHDILVEIHTTVTSMNESFKEHIKDDKNSFDQVHKRVNGLMWYVAMGVGGLAALELYIKFFKG